MRFRFDTVKMPKIPKVHLNMLNITYMLYILDTFNNRQQVKPKNVGYIFTKTALSLHLLADCFNTHNLMLCYLIGQFAFEVWLNYVFSVNIHIKSVRIVHSNSLYPIHTWQQPLSFFVCEHHLSMCVISFTVYSFVNIYNI